MQDDTFNMSIRKFLKMVGVGSQHEIEQAVAQAMAEGRLNGNEKLPVKMTLSIGSINFNINYDGMIELE